MKKIETTRAPKAVGPYSQGIALEKGKELFFISGQLPLIPETGQLLQGTVQELTKQIIQNLEAILETCQCTLKDVVRVEVFMTNLKDFKEMNEEYARHFEGPTYPARQTVQVAALPLGASIEISCIAAK